MIIHKNYKEWLDVDVGDKLPDIQKKLFNEIAVPWYVNDEQSPSTIIKNAIHMKNDSFLHQKTDICYYVANKYDEETETTSKMLVLFPFCSEVMGGDGKLGYEIFGAPVFMVIQDLEHQSKEGVYGSSCKTYYAGEALDPFTGETCEQAFDSLDVEKLCEELQFLPKRIQPDLPTDETEVRIVEPNDDLIMRFATDSHDDVRRFGHILLELRERFIAPIVCECDKKLFDETMSVHKRYMSYVFQKMRDECRSYARHIWHPGITASDMDILVRHYVRQNVVQRLLVIQQMASSVIHGGKQEGSTPIVDLK